MAVVVEAPEAPAAETVERCGCGRAKTHVGMCATRALKAAHTRKTVAGIRRGFTELDEAIHLSAADIRADEELVLAAKLLLLGMWSRDPNLLALVVGSTPSKVRAIVERYESSGLWSDGVIACGESEETGEIEFWMNAMVGVGSMEVDLTDPPRYRCPAGRP